MGQVPLGLRFYTDDEIFDVDRHSLHHVGVYNLDLAGKVEMHLVDKLWLSKEDTKMTITDLSGATESISSLLDSLPSMVRKTLSSITRPHEQTLLQFLSDPYWKPNLITSDSEASSNYEMLKPDGTKWDGGWIGKFSNVKRIKTAFHYTQVAQALHRGEHIDAEIYWVYPDLMEVVKVTALFKEYVSTSKGVLEIAFGVKPLYIPLASWPTRVSDARDLITNSHLPLDRIKGLKQTTIKGVYNTFTLVDILLIAIKQLLIEERNKYSSTQVELSVLS
jgi:hypothetical protein